MFVDLTAWASQLQEAEQPWCPNKSKLNNVTPVATGLTSDRSISAACLQVHKTPGEYIKELSMSHHISSDDNKWAWVQFDVSLLTGFFHLRVPESSAVGSAVGRIKAHDLDIGKNAEVDYTIVPGDGGAMFDITTNEHNQEGIIILKRVWILRNRPNVRHKQRISTWKHPVAQPAQMTSEALESR